MVDFNGEIPCWKVQTENEDNWKSRFQISLVSITAKSKGGCPIVARIKPRGARILKI